jgi:DNA polymerase delta subunit 1
MNQDTLAELLEAINSNMEQKKDKSKKQTQPAVLDMITIGGNSIRGHTWDKTEVFIKVVLCSPKVVAACRDMLEDGIVVGAYGNVKFKTYESDIAFVLRFMIDVDMVGGGWVEVEGGDYDIVRNQSSRSSSTCQLEINTSWDSITCHKPEGEWSKIAPLRILSFDIECAGRKGVFPQPEKDPVIQIANYVHVQGSENKDGLVRNVFNLRSCSPLVEAEVICFENEVDMLSEWQRFVREIDPDIIIGYNIANFDIPYLVTRAKVLKLNTFSLLGRLKNDNVWIKNSTFSSKAYGTKEKKECHLAGRIILDIMEAIQRDHKLRSYTLNSVSEIFLSDLKDDVHHSQITTLFNGSESDRMRLAKYCFKDAHLPWRLMEKLMILYNFVEMARVTGVPIDYLLAKGQQVKVLVQIYREGKKDNRFIPYTKSKGPKTKGEADEETYEGASVLEPKKGFYDIPIPTLDFASLYPSIMIAHNLCYTTLLDKSELKKLDPSQYEETPNGDFFLRSGVVKGILPRILENLLSARKKAKDDLKNETDKMKKAVLDGRQLALKVSANSVYGFTGAFVGKMPCMAISSGVTAFGRDMIKFTQKTVEETYSKKNGYENDAEVIYGDTDSVMVKFGVTDVKKAMDMGIEAAKLVTDKIGIHPISLAFEKIYFPYLLINKKRYAGLYWTKPTKYDKMDAKGIETVRRDSCKLVAIMMQKCLDFILIQRNPKMAQEYVKSVIADLLADKIDMSLLVITKALSKSADEYEFKQAQSELAKRMKERDPLTAPSIGDRVKYVMTQVTKGKAYQMSEDPIFVLENEIPIDYKWYIDKQIKGPMTRLFESIMENPESLFIGSHASHRVIPTPKGGMTNFIVKYGTCLGCKAKLNPGQKAVCDQCKKDEDIIYMKKVSDMNELEREFSKLWTQCQICQGSLHQKVICSNDECKLFYKRTKCRSDLSKIEKQVSEFSLDW